MQVLNYNLNFKGKSDNTKPYQKTDFISNTVILKDADIIDSVINAASYDVDKNNVYERIGKLFENSNLYQNARDFYLRRYENLVKNSSSKNDIKDALDDMDRISKKANSIDLKA